MNPRNYLVAVTMACLAGPSSLNGQTAPRYTNVELVSVNTLTRLLVIKNTNGHEETFELDDNVAGFDGLRAGDRVMLTVRDQPGRDRVSSISKSTATTKAPVAQTAAARPAEDPAPAAVDPALRRFAEQVEALAQQAGRVDATWNDFKASCSVTLRSSYSDGRDWFSLWDGGAQMDVSGGSCRDLFNQVVSQGETVKTGMIGAEEAARKASVEPGDLRLVMRRHSMEWGGWGLPAPDSLKQ